MYAEHIHYKWDLNLKAHTMNILSYNKDNMSTVAKRATIFENV